MSVTRRHITVSEAAQENESLAKLWQLARESGERLTAIKPLIPTNLHPYVKGGAIRGDTWRLLVQGNAAAAKLRQLLPSLQAHLRHCGYHVEAIEIKVMI